MDKLVRVHLRCGRDALALIHVEIQGSKVTSVERVRLQRKRDKTRQEGLQKGQQAPVVLQAKQQRRVFTRNIFVVLDYKLSGWLLIVAGITFIPDTQNPTLRCAEYCLSNIQYV